MNLIEMHVGFRIVITKNFMSNMLLNGNHTETEFSLVIQLLNRQENKDSEFNLPHFPEMFGFSLTSKFNARFEL